MHVCALEDLKDSSGALLILHPISKRHVGFLMHTELRVLYSSPLFSDRDQRSDIVFNIGIDYWNTRVTGNIVNVIVRPRFLSGRLLSYLQNRTLSPRVLE